MITIEIDNIDRSSLINWESVSIDKRLTNTVDTASFSIIRIGNGYKPNESEEVVIKEDGVSIFGGYITMIEENLGIVDGCQYLVKCQDYSYDLGGLLVAKTYTNETGEDIIKDIITENASSFNTDNVICDVNIAKIVFNQVSITDCLNRISKLIGFEWFVGPDKDIHFFERFSLLAPFTLTDTNGNYIYRSLKRTIDATQIANQVKVRGGLGTETTLFDDIITVKGDETLSFNLPYKFSGLQIFVNTVEKTVGIDNIDEFPDKDVLYNYQMDSIRFENTLNDGDEIKFQGFKKYPVIAILSDDASIALRGLREKIIFDNTIENTMVARERAFLELELAKDVITDCSFRTYEGGLECGMRITLDSDKRDIDEMDYLITTINFRTRTPEEFEYTISASTARKMGLTEFLKDLARRGDSFREDDSEVAEIVKTDVASFQVEELIENISANEDNQDFEIEELLQDSDVEPIWVLSPYVPTSIDDTKRAGRLDRSMKLT